MSHATTNGLARRGFLARMSVMAGAGAALAAPSRLRAMLSPAAPLTAASDPDGWIARVRGTDRVLVHAHQRLLQALAAADGLLRDGQAAYGIAESNHGIAVGMHGPAIGGIFTDAVWDRFALGEFYKINEPGGAAVARNPFLRPQEGAPAGAAIPPLMERGVVFVGCNVAVRNLARRLAGAGRGGVRDPEALHEALLADVQPGVTVVPNLFVSITRAQRQGLSYLFID